MSQYGVTSGSHQAIDIPNPQNPSEALPDTIPTGLAGLNTHDLVTNLIHGKTGNLPQGVGMWMIGPDGTRQVIAEDQILGAKQSGFIFDTPWDRKVAAYVRDNDGFGGALKAFGLSGVNEALFGLPERLRDPLTQEEHQQLNLAHPTAHLFGNIAGIGAQIAATEGLGATAAIEGAMFGGEAATSIGAAVGREAATSAVMGGLYTAPYSIQTLVFDHNPMAAGEQILAGIGLGAGLGAGFQGLRGGLRFVGRTLAGAEPGEGLLSHIANPARAAGRETAVKDAAAAFATTETAFGRAKQASQDAIKLHEEARIKLSGLHIQQGELTNTIDDLTEQLTKLAPEDVEERLQLQEQIADLRKQVDEIVKQIPNQTTNVESNWKALEAELNQMNFPAKAALRINGKVYTTEYGKAHVDVANFARDVDGNIPNVAKLFEFGTKPPEWGYWTDIPNSPKIIGPKANPTAQTGRFISSQEALRIMKKLDFESSQISGHFGWLKELDEQWHGSTKYLNELHSDLQMYGDHLKEVDTELSALDPQAKNRADLLDQKKTLQGLIEETNTKIVTAAANVKTAGRSAAGAAQSQKAAQNAMDAASAIRDQAAKELGIPDELVTADDWAAHFRHHVGKSAGELLNKIPPNLQPWMMLAYMVAPHSIITNFALGGTVLNYLLETGATRDLLINSTEGLGRALSKTASVLGAGQEHAAFGVMPNWKAMGRTAPPLIGAALAAQLGQKKKGLAALSPEENVIIGMRFISQYTGNPQPVMRAVNKFMKQAQVPPLTRIGLGRQLDRNMRYLQQHAPKIDQPTPFSHSRGQHIAPSAVHKFLRIAAAVENPMGVVANVAKGTATADEIQAVQATYPMLWQNLSERLLRGVLDKPLPYAQRLSLQAFTGEAFDQAYDPQRIAMTQAEFQPQPAPASRGTPKDLSTAYATQLEQIDRDLS